MNDSLKSYLQPSFLIAVILLSSFAGGMYYFKSQKGLTLVKKALPLQKPFAQLDESQLGDYVVIDKAEIENLDILESLGTEEYLQWTLEDKSADTYSPVKQCSLFITYYTGNPDQVPHVPEACYVGGGNQVVDKFSPVFDVSASDVNMPEKPKSGKISATGLVFGKKTTEIWQAAATFPVIYFFKANGTYCAGRNSVRLELADLANEYSYFSKVEIKFFNVRGLYPDKEQATAATEKLLRTILPVLEKNHWPNWADANK